MSKSRQKIAAHNNIRQSDGIFNQESSISEIGIQRFQKIFNRFYGRLFFLKAKQRNVPLRT